MNFQGIRGLKSFKAAMAVAMVLGASAFAPAPGSRRINPVPNVAGEQLLPRRPKRLKPIDYDVMSAADGKRKMRAYKRDRAKANGGWAATQSWLDRVAEKQARVAG